MKTISPVTLVDAYSSAFGGDEFLVMKTISPVTLVDAYSSAFGGHDLMGMNHRIQGKRFGSVRADNYPAHLAFSLRETAVSRSDNAAVSRSENAD